MECAVFKVKILATKEPRFRFPKPGLCKKLEAEVVCYGYPFAVRGKVGHGIELFNFRYRDSLGQELRELRAGNAVTVVFRCQSGEVKIPGENLDVGECITHGNGVPFPFLGEVP